MNNQNDTLLTRHIQSSDLQLHNKIEALVLAVTPPDSPNKQLYHDMLLTIARMAEADRDRWDAKIMLQTLREMEAAFSLLSRFQRRRKVTVFGSARTSEHHPVYQQAELLGSLLAKNNLMVITGAGGGVMAAAHAGAGLENSLGLNINLPFEQGANATVENSDNLLTFHFFFLRKLFFVKEADALVLCPGGFGTLDEALEVLTLIQTGKSPLVPVVLLDQPNGQYWSQALAFMQEQLLDNHYISKHDLELMRLVHSPEEAVQEVIQFYQNYHSSRWLKKEFIIRIKHLLTEAALATLNQQFSDLCIEGSFKQLPNCYEIDYEPELCKLARLSFKFNNRDFGKLRLLVDFINRPENFILESN
ncbi:cytochrome D ubiquinol oxidase subunit II [Thiopseudomonas alkaliphila]|uniref:LOG family protein n=1 Tax=Thiopseudomonas alkaliphila TaxID=1697053 RepID=UPI00069E5695|nr:TIGR00730 family Rossman fold protein [Thiopseudomonas alkaliphila]AKX45734.1 cytochrome D ubiquinol oxidase subunit II [Thiopseudomonas alkaliphila]AKX49004.1 cytochrome D ubiquinol oxidase subunit II [Thiopseudomonas alkaliphila]AKX50604.1 cytochrome D ubiquinol oxidase subunit II [Thiopseudomonas alkaliphila]AKX54894.1 cytochrome D ubiquinol oxidase subunit II [Thiopseudomonas alkaliphila]